MLYTLGFFFSSKCSLFHNANLFGSCIIHILYTECAKIKKNNSGAKGLNERGSCFGMLYGNELYVCVWSSSCKQGIKLGVTTTVMLLTHC